MKLHLPRLSLSAAIVDQNGRPTPTYLRYHSGLLDALEGATDDVAGQNAAITGATTAATTATSTAAGAVSAAQAVQASLALALSYTNPTDLLTYGYDPNTGARTITIAAHQRVYQDGTSVAVAGGTVTGLQPATTYYVTYTDVAHAGGTVTYLASINVASTVQVQGRHLIGSITTGSL